MSSLENGPVWRQVSEALVGFEQHPDDPMWQTALAVALAAKGETVAAEMIRQMVAIFGGESLALAERQISSPPKTPKLPSFDVFAGLVSLDVPLRVISDAHQALRCETEPTVDEMASVVARLARCLCPSPSDVQSSAGDELRQLTIEIDRPMMQPDRGAYMARIAWLVQRRLQIWHEDVWGFLEPPFGSVGLIRAVTEAPASCFGPRFGKVHELANDASGLLAIARLWSDGKADELDALEKACVLLAQNTPQSLRSEFIEELGTYGLLRAVAALDAIEVSRRSVCDAIFLFRVRDAYLDNDDAKRALVVQQRICDRWPDNSDEFVVLGEIALAAGRFRQAEQAYTQVLTLHPAHGKAVERLSALAAGHSPVVHSQAYGTPPDVKVRRASMKDPVRRQAALDHLVHTADAIFGGSINLTRRIIRDSDHHWYDTTYYASLDKLGAFQHSGKRSIRTIALYYWRLHNGGTERVTSRLARLWRALGYRVLLLTDEAPSKFDYDSGSGIERFQLPPHRSRYVDRGTALARLFRDHSVDLFVSNLWVETATSWDLFVAKSLGIPVIVGWHNVFDAGIYNGYDIQFFQQRLAAYRHADLVVALSMMDQYWFSTQGIASRLIHNPLTFTSMPNEVSKRSSKKIIWMGRTEKHQKRIDHVIRMLPIVLQKVPEATLMIVGDGPDRREMELLAHSLGVASAIRFTGYSSVVEDYLSDAAVHVMTSEFEGSPMVISEAWAHGIPTVMYDLAFLEFLRDGKGFISVDQLDLKALGNEVARVLSDDSLRTRLGKEARATAQAFFDIDIGGEWKSVFDALEHGDDLNVPIAPQNVASVAPLLTRHLAERIYAVDARATQEARAAEAARAPLPSFQRGPRLRAGHILKPQATKQALKGMLRDLSDTTVKRVINLGVEALSRRPTIVFRKLKTIDFAHIGLGDNLMAWVGLHALLVNDVAVTAPECRLYVPNELAGLATALFSRYDIHVCGVAAHARVDHVSPVFSPLPPEGIREWYRTFIGSDWRMNCFEALDNQKTLPRANARSDATSRFRLGLSERILYRRDGLNAASPDYIGYRLWLPVARELGLQPLTFLTQMKRALASLRTEFRAFVNTNFAGAVPGPAIAVFPAGKSFQAFSPNATRSLCQQLPDTAVFYVQSNDPWIAEYRASGIEPRNVDTIGELFWIIRSARRVMTTDSFSSHIAQLMRDDFVLALTRDFKENIVHPGAHPTIIANHPGCAPCNYAPRNETAACVGGYGNCIAFDSPDFIAEIATAMLAYPVPAEVARRVHSIA